MSVDPTDGPTDHAQNTADLLSAFEEAADEPIRPEYVETDTGPKLPTYASAGAPRTRPPP